MLSFVLSHNYNIFLQIDIIYISKNFEIQKIVIHNIHILSLYLF